MEVLTTRKYNEFIVNIDPIEARFLRSKDRKYFYDLYLCRYPSNRNMYTFYLFVYSDTEHITKPRSLYLVRDFSVALQMLENIEKHLEVSNYKTAGDFYFSTFKSTENLW